MSGEFFAKKAKEQCLNMCIRAGEAYLGCFGIPVGDLDKLRATHVISTTVVALMKAGKDDKKRLCVSLSPVSGVGLY